MTTELIIKDERGSLRIVVSLVTFQYGQTDKDGNSFRYDVMVLHKAPKKRSEIRTTGIATEQEIMGAKIKLWNSIKP